MNEAGHTRQVVFLVGGRGTRLGSITQSVPKPLVPVGGKPFLDYLIANALRQGFDDIILSCGYLAERIAERYQSSNDASHRVRLVVEPEPAGTAGGLWYCRNLLAPMFMMCNGDTYFDTDWQALTAFAASHGAAAALALRDVAPGRRYGTVRLEGDHIRAFQGPSENMPGPMNAGLYVMRRQVVDRIATRPCSMEQDIFPAMAEAGDLVGQVGSGYFIDIGIPEDLERADTEIPALFS